MADPAKRKLLYVGHTNPWGTMSGSGFCPRICNELQKRDLLHGAMHPFDKSLRYLNGVGYNSLAQKVRRKLTYENPFLQIGSRPDSGMIESESEGQLPIVLSRMEPNSPVLYHFHTPKFDGRFQLRRFLFQDLTPTDAFKYGAYGHSAMSAKDIDEKRERIKRVLHAPEVGGVFTFSTYGAQSIAQEYDFPRERIVAIGCGPLRSYWNADAVTPLRYEKAQILFVGRNWEKKGGPVLLEAFKAVRARIPHATLVVVGPIEQPNDTIGVKGVRFLGRVRDSKVVQVFRESSVFCMLPQCETWGIVYVEAANAGLPIVGFAKWGLLDIVEDGVTGSLVHENRAEAVANSLHKMLENPHRMCEMGHAANERVRSTLDWPHVVNRLESAIWQR